MVAIPTFVYAGNVQLNGGPASTRVLTEGGNVFGGFGITTAYGGFGLLMPRAGRTVPCNPATGVMPASPTHLPWYDGSTDIRASTGAGADTVTVAGTPWDVGEWANVSGLRTVTVTAGVGAGQTRTIASNTTSQLTVTPAWTTPPTASTIKINGGFCVYHHTNGRADTLFPGSAIVPGRRGCNWYEGTSGESNFGGGLTPANLFMQALEDRFGGSAPYFKFVKTASAGGVGGVGGWGVTGWTTFVNGHWADAQAAAGPDTLDPQCVVIDASHKDIVDANFSYATDIQNWIDLIRGTPGFETCLIMLVSHKSTMYGGIAAPVIRDVNRLVANANANVKLFDMEWGSFASTTFSQPIEPALAENYDTNTYLEAGQRMFNEWDAWNTDAPAAIPGTGIATYVILTDSQGNTLQATYAVAGLQATILGEFGSDIRPGQYIFNGQTWIVELYNVLSNPTTFPAHNANFGFENTFLKRMAQEHPDGVCLFKHTLNGAALCSESVAAGAVAAYEAGANDLWPVIITRWNTFRSAILRDINRSPDVLGVLVAIGDNDEFSSTTATAFATKIRLWINDIREVFTTRATGPSLGITFLQPPKHISLEGGQSQHGNAAARESIRATIASLASLDRVKVLLSNAGRYELQRNDKIHYGGEATYAIGYDFAEQQIAFESDEGETEEESTDDSPSESATFVVEDGSGLTTSNSYCSVADGDDFHEHHGNPNDWLNATTVEKQDALRQATSQLDWRYGPDRWAGYQVDADQALAWPRSCVADLAGGYYDSDEIPTRLARLTAYAALLVLQGVEICPEQVEGGDIKSESKQMAGGFAKSITYQGSKPATPELRQLERMALSYGLVTGGGGWGQASV